MNSPVRLWTSFYSAFLGALKYLHSVPVRPSIGRSVTQTFHNPPSAPNGLLGLVVFLILFQLIPQMSVITRGGNNFAKRVKEKKEAVSPQQPRMIVNDSQSYLLVTHAREWGITLWCIVHTEYLWIKKRKLYLFDVNIYRYYTLNQQQLQHHKAVRSYLPFCSVVECLTLWAKVSQSNCISFTIHRVICIWTKREQLTIAHS